MGPAKCTFASTPRNPYRCHLDILAPVWWIHLCFHILRVGGKFPWKFILFFEKNMKEHWWLSIFVSERFKWDELDTPNPRPLKTACIQNNKNCNRPFRKTLHNNDRLNRLNGNFISCKQYIYFIVFVSRFISRLFAVKFSINLMLLWNTVSPYERYVTKVITCMHSSATVTTAFIS